jgi:hypothetical protein
VVTGEGKTGSRFWAGYKEQDNGDAATVADSAADYHADHLADLGIRRRAVVHVRRQLREVTLLVDAS